MFSENSRKRLTKMNRKHLILSHTWGLHKRNDTLQTAINRALLPSCKLVCRWLIMALRMVPTFITLEHCARPRAKSSFQQAFIKLMSLSWPLQNNKWSIQISYKHWVQIKYICHFLIHMWQCPFNIYETMKTFLKNVKILLTWGSERQVWSVPSA